MAKHRAETAEDRAMARVRGWQERAIERNKAKYAPFEKPYCQDFNDPLDGFTIHAPECPYHGQPWISGYQCIDPRLHSGVWPAGLAEVR